MRQAFTYHRAIAPMLWVMVGLSSVELVVVHGLLAWWHSQVALVASLATLAGLAWLVATIRSFRRLPVTIEASMLTMRVGRLKTVRLPASRVRGLRSDWTAQAIKRPDVLNLALLAYPNVVVALTGPERVGRRSVEAIAHRLDDPAGFAAAIEALGRHDDG